MGPDSAAVTPSDSVWRVQPYILSSEFVCKCNYDVHPMASVLYDVRKFALVAATKLRVESFDKYKAASFCYS